MWHLMCTTFIFVYIWNTHVHTEGVKQSGDTQVKEITDAFVEARKSTISGEHNSHMETSIPFPPSYKHISIGKI